MKVTLLLAILISISSAASLRAQYRFGKAGADARWSNSANWTGPGGWPSGPGIVAEMATSESYTTALDRDVTVGALRNRAGTARVWTITNEGGFTITLEQPPGAVNQWGNHAAEIRVQSSGGLACAANLRLRGTDLDIGTIASNHAVAQITISGAITAEGDQTITIRNARRQTVLQGKIGANGTGGITLVNLSSGTPGDANQLVITGDLGPKVIELIQGEGVCDGLVVAGANPEFRGRVTVSANALTVQSGATLGDFNTVRVADGARLNLSDANALGRHAGLELEAQGEVVLNFSGIREIDSLSFDGGTIFAAPGEVWGGLGSSAPSTSKQIKGPGLLRVTPAAAAAAANTR